MYKKKPEELSKMLFIYLVIFIKLLKYYSQLFRKTSMVRRNILKTPLITCSGLPYILFCMLNSLGSWNKC